ncbi:mitochondrial zinc maintenance protein 1, mitochondrial [Rhizodiscina lignyota]|uniref:Mitochondrial zinc maintenance protein 1, mitochondrial n=1 Tax=Rhizodiscina lignyota TaxID=1504668 RepID=A0A9P4IAS6_9PEZI|nr:mitochondrial zinc maintenance protein 1, mitochondrial [Rhizodiscina lignyota]
MAAREMALAAYRHVLRSARIAFEGDSIRLTAARSAAREGFEGNKTLPPGGEAALSGIQHAEGVAQILRENVVQGKATDSDGSKYKLRIHQETELGDNETLMGGTGLNSNVTGKCGQL